MDIALKKIRIRDLVEGYKDSGVNGVTAYGGKLDVRPPYQREFIYKGKQRDAVIRTVMKKFPLNVMYWVVRDDGGYEVLDGQQRTISICQFFNNDFSVDMRIFNNYEADEVERFLDYELMIYFCTGTDSEKLDWFRTINIAGERLSDQELRNAVYHGPWVADAKTWFSKPGAPAAKISSSYISAKADRQEILEMAFDWISEGGIEQYMSIHAKDPNANALWSYFQSVITWIENTFVHSKDREKILKGVDWGPLFKKYGSVVYDTKQLESRIQELLMDDDVSNQKGIIPYVLTGNEKYLNIRAFSDKQKLKAYTLQKGKCKLCGAEFPLDQMHADHIKPWSKGGHTDDKNCQMLCHTCNFTKSNK